jgi:outer membrane biosynthesis protein TonB
VSGDGGASCQEFKKSTATWGWISGAGGTAKMNLTAGAASIRIYVEGGETHLANLLLTLDTSCVPAGDGSNCVQQPLQLSVAGIQQGDIISGSITVETFVTNKTVNGARVEYYLDNASTPYSTSTQSPYCLVLTANSCAGWPSSTLSNGQHKLTIRGVSEGNPTEKIITFTVNNTSGSPAPAPTPTPSPTPSSRPTPTPTPSPTPSPSSRPAPAPAPTPSPAASYSTGTKTTTSVPKADATQIAAENANTTTTPTTSQTGVIENLDNTNTSKTTSGTALVAGLSVAGTLKGSVIITTPKDIALEIGDVVELLVDGKLIETKTVDTPVSTASFTLDTTKLKNGKSVVSIRITRENGEISTYSSNVEIANGTVASTVGTAKKSWLSIALSVLGILILVLSLIFLARYIISKRQYEDAHNIQNYTYVQPENPYYPAAGATLAVLFAVFAVLTVRGSSNAANVGYLYKLSDGTIPQEFALANDTTNNLAYVKMSDNGTTPGGDMTGNNPTPPPSTPPTTPTTPTTPATPPPATTADYKSNLDLLLAAASRNKKFDNASRVNTKSVDLYDNPELYGNPDEFNGNGHGAYNGDLIRPQLAMFRTECAFSHFSYDDPIVYPNKPGAAHLHMNFGNTHTNAYSTYSTLIDSGNGTCSGMELNRTAYWAPAMIDDQGNARVPWRILVYYKAQGPIVGKVSLYPEGLKLLIGPEITYGATADTAFACNYTEPTSKNIVNCANHPTKWLHMQVAFPRCLKQGVNFDDYNNVWANSTGGWWWSDCPPGTTTLPMLKYNIFYRVEAGEDSSKWHLSSDVDRNTKQQGGSGLSLHGDWFGAWNKKTNQDFLDKCLNNTAVANSTGLECGFGSFTPCVQASGLNCVRYADGYDKNAPKAALKAILPDPGYNKVPLKQLRKEICPQAPLPDSASWNEYSYCVNP